MNSAILSNIILKFTGVSDSFICLSASLFLNFIFFLESAISDVSQRNKHLL